MKNIGQQTILDAVKTLPEKPGVYRMLSESEHVLYVGKAKNLKSRVRSYTLIDKLPLRLQRMVFNTRSLEIITTNSEVAALILESQLIKKLQPRYNILLKDDKSFPYIYIQKEHRFPQMYKKRGVNTATAHSFGPFASVDSVDETLIALQKIFKLRNCSDSFFKGRKLPCLQYHIKRCSAPCVEKVTHEKYTEQQLHTMNFLKGKTQSVQTELQKKMMAASQSESFELAANYRDQILSLNKIQAHQHINLHSTKDADVIALHQEKGCVGLQVFFVRNGYNYGNRSYFPSHIKDQDTSEIMQQFILQFYTKHSPPKHILLSHPPAEQTMIETALNSLHNTSSYLSTPQRGEKHTFMQHALNNAQIAVQRALMEQTKHIELLRLLGKFVGATRPLKRIEVYDNSHIQGKHAVGAFIVANEDGFDKKSYRKFTIKDSQVMGDDFGMMKEIFERRFNKVEEKSGWELPDLIIIDGGIGQLNSATNALKNYHFSCPPILMAVAKGPDRNAGREKLLLHGQSNIQLDFNDPLLFFIQRLRDESHRFVITTHRSKRDKSMVNSSLNDIPNIGPTRKKALLHYFGSVKPIKTATLEELSQVRGISPKVAKVIYDFFNS